MSTGLIRSSRAFVPTLLPLAVAMASGVVVDGCTPLSISTVNWVILGVIAVAIGVVCEIRGLCTDWVVCVGIMAFGGGWHHYWDRDLAVDDPARADWSAGERPAWIRGVVVEAAAFRPGTTRPDDPGSTRLTVGLTAIRNQGAWRTASGRVVVTVTGDRSDLEAGAGVQAAGTLGPIDGPRNPGEFDPRPMLRARGIRLRMSVGAETSVWPDPEAVDWPWTRRLGSVRAWAVRTLAQGLDPAVAPLASALLLGRREAVDPEVNDAFARTGTTHLLAISGLHLQVLAVLLGSSLRMLGTPRRMSLLAVMAATVGYAILVGLAPSVVRSTTMTLGACLAGWRDRCTTAGNLMAGAMLATLLRQPADLFDVGCQLSFLAVGVILWCVPPLLAWGLPVLTRLDELEQSADPWWVKLRRWTFGWIQAGLVGSAAVWLAAWPLVALRFHLASPIGILLNLPLIPLTSLALLLAGATLLASAIAAWLAVPFAWACGKTLAWTEVAVRRGTAWNHGHAFVIGPSTSDVIIFYGLFALALSAEGLRWGWSRWAWGALIAWGGVLGVRGLATEAPATPEAEVLAVGHGLAVVIRSPEGRAVLYDCGRQGDPHVGRRVVAPALWARGIRGLDAVILTHADADHYNGLPDLLDRVPVATLRVPPGFASAANPGAMHLVEAAKAHGAVVSTIAAGDRLDLGGGMMLTVLHPGMTGLDDTTDNARSVVLAVESAGERLLLTGDLEREGLGALMAQPPPDPPPAAMLAPHHGGRTSNPMSLYSWARPKAVLVSQREPAPGTNDALKPLIDREIPLLRTWERGAIRLRWQPTGLLATGFLDPGTVEPLKVNRFLKAGMILAGLSIGVIVYLIVIATEWGAWSLVMPGRRLTPPGEPIGREIRAVAGDGTTLTGAWFPAAGERDRSRVILLLHGLGEDRSALMGRVEPLVAAGWDVAALDGRASGLSGGRRVGYSSVASGDVVAWLDALEPLAGPGATFAAWGRSLGASAAARAAAIDPRITSLVLEATSVDLREAVAAVLGRFHLPSWLARSILIRARKIAGYALDQPGLLELVSNLKVRALILHGNMDNLVPIDLARKLAAAFPEPAEILEVEEAQHANVVGVGGDGLMNRVVKFLSFESTNRKEPLI
jgi:competence protein ComEC